MPKAGLEVVNTVEITAKGGNIAGRLPHGEQTVDLQSGKMSRKGLFHLYGGRVMKFRKVAGPSRRSQLGVGCPSGTPWSAACQRGAMSLQCPPGM